ncbi:hypothetical protein HZS_6038, partial [Henneguya salminicola]
LSLVFAGSCINKIKRIIASLRHKYPPEIDPIEKATISHPSYYMNPISGNHLYGFHMALNMSLGLLCLGSGFLTLTTSSLETYCMLVIALYPVFPNVSSDNYNYFQPLRHLYALACTKSRHLILIDDNLEQEFVKQTISLIYHSSEKLEKTRFVFKSPFALILKEFNTFTSLEIKSSHCETVKLDSHTLSRN